MKVAIRNLGTRILKSIRGLQQQQLSRARQTQLQIECLEQREVPATLLWNGAVPENFFDRANWTVLEVSNNIHDQLNLNQNLTMVTQGESSRGLMSHDVLKFTTNSHANATYNPGKNDVSSFKGLIIDGYQGNIILQGTVQGQRI